MSFLSPCCSEAFKNKKRKTNRQQQQQQQKDEMSVGTLCEQKKEL
jgi:hypothetical protein